jgi:MFS family permease
MFGILSDKVGRKRSAFAASAMAAVFTAACLGATSYWALLALRLLTGAGAALLQQGCAGAIMKARPTGPVSLPHGAARWVPDAPQTHTHAHVAGGCPAHTNTHATGVGVAGQALGAYLLATEMIGPSWRGAAGIITQCFFIAGEFALVIIAVALPSWRGQFAAGALLCAASALLWWVVPESGRWLQVQGRAAEAQQVKTTSVRSTRRLW